MANRKWYREAKLMVPAAATVLVAIIGVVGVWLKTDDAATAGKPVAQEEQPETAPTADPTAPTPSAPEARTVIVVLIDDTEERITGARILLDEQGISRETDSHGRVTLRVRTDLAKLRLTVSKAGYQTQNLELDVFEGMDPVRIRLKPQ